MVDYQHEKESCEADLKQSKSQLQLLNSQIQNKKKEFQSIHGQVEEQVCFVIFFLYNSFLKNESLNYLNDKTKELLQNIKIKYEQLERVKIELRKQRQMAKEQHSLSDDVKRLRQTRESEQMEIEHIRAAKENLMQVEQNTPDSALSCVQEVKSLKKNLKETQMQKAVRNGNVSSQKEALTVSINAVNCETSIQESDQRLMNEIVSLISDVKSLSESISISRTRLLFYFLCLRS